MLTPSKNGIKYLLIWKQVKQNFIFNRIEFSPYHEFLFLQGTGGISNSLFDKTDKIKKVRDEYERKISDMQKELRKLQSAQKEHARQQRELHSQESQLRNLKNELFEMKATKVWNS